MSRRVHILLALCVVLTPLLALPANQAGAHEPANDPFQNTWARSDLPVSEDVADRTWMWGPSGNTGAITEPYADSPGGERVVQYFDKTRMEINNPNGDSGNPWYVTNGLLATELITGRLQVGDDQFIERAPANIPVAGDLDDLTSPTYATMNQVRGRDARPLGGVITEEIDRSGQVTTDSGRAEYNVVDAHYVSQTGHNVASVFWDFMNDTGTIVENGRFVEGSIFPDPFFATGFPLTKAYWSTMDVDDEPTDVLVQVFQRRVLTYTPSNPDGWRVEAGNVGLHYYDWVYEHLGMNEPDLLDTANNEAECLDPVEQEFLDLLNQHRQRNGLGQLENSAVLNVASYNHSVDMGERNYFAHNSPEGITPFQRMTAEGYDYNTYRSENLAAGYETADEVFRVWDNSPAHKTNMLASGAQVVGIARVEVPGSRYGVYWTTKFGGYVDDAPQCQ